ncbi:MAG: ABC transporter permease [Lachnospiraceae bacterium]|nr:ABC transporter permease [Lachnospiraceae bacterium]MCI8914918.1 ABC transporter permease [Lawsonibacter sp.]
MTCVIVPVYLVAIVLFYILAGDQLHLRSSRGNVKLPPADGWTVELAAGNVVEQYFEARIECLQQIDVQWGNFYRPNTGTVMVELILVGEGRVVMSQSFQAAELTEGAITSLIAEEPIEGLGNTPLLVRISSPDGQTGSSVAPLLSTQTRLEAGRLYINGAEAEGTLCFAATGIDYIWTGLHYWTFAGIGLVVLLGALCVIWYRCRVGKRSYVVEAVAAVRKYDFLIQQLVARDFKVKYKRSVLGMFWSFLNPLLMMSVQYVVFSTIFKNDVPNFAVYLLIGVVSFNFLSESCGMALGAILGNYSLITKVYVPKYIYPLTRVMSSVVNLSISLIPLLIMSFLTGVQFRKATVLALYFFACLIIFCLGLGLLLSALMVFFRDTQFLWNVFTMMWCYATPIFYPERILPDTFRFILVFNPLYHFLKNIRMCILEGLSPEPAVYAQCLMIALGMVAAGAWVFKKTQDKFVLYL